jgi:hypothetical protein
MKQYQVDISNMFAAFENLHNREDITRAWENIQENIRSSYKDSVVLYKLRHHKPQFWRMFTLFRSNETQHTKMPWI